MIGTNCICSCKSNYNTITTALKNDRKKRYYTSGWIHSWNRLANIFIYEPNRYYITACIVEITSRLIYFSVSRLLTVNSFLKSVLLKPRASWHGITPPPPFFLLCVYIFIFNQILFISLLFHLFFLILTCSRPYSYNLMLTATYRCRPYIYIMWIKQMICHWSTGKESKNKQKNNFKKKRRK
jgi:hypothetical protein